MTRTYGAFPRTRLRRLRRNEKLRALVQEHRLHPSDLIQSVIVREPSTPAAIAAMPGVARQTAREATETAERCLGLGVPAMALFPHTDAAGRDGNGSLAMAADNVMAEAAAAIKKTAPELILIADVALDPYTDHGHDGLMAADGTILNDETVTQLCQQAAVLAEAGFDVIAPSDMMDGRIGLIRDALDKLGHEGVAILSYAVKYASAFYGPYREAVGSEGALKGDKRTYQMDPANRLEGDREAALDIAEGADMLMVKPGLPYLDMIARIKERFGHPTFAFHVSGEYAMLRAASDLGALDYGRALLETLLAFKRAGADGVITYAALDAAALLQGEGPS